MGKPIKKKREPLIKKEIPEYDLIVDGKKRPRTCEGALKPLFDFAEGRITLSNAPQILHDAFEHYLDHCQDENKFPNIAGFCRHYGISKNQFYKLKTYKNYDNYKNVLDKINTSLEDETIQFAMAAKNPAFAIFYMKNKFGYSDKREYETKSVSMNIDPKEISNKSNEQIEARIKELLSSRDEIIEVEATQNE